MRCVIQIEGQTWWSWQPLLVIFRTRLKTSNVNIIYVKLNRFKLSGWYSPVEKDGTRWRTGGEVKGKLANGMGSQSPFTLPRNVVYPASLPLMCTPRLPVFDWTDAPTDLNGLVRFVERRNMVSARVPSHLKCSITSIISPWITGLLSLSISLSPSYSL